MSHSTSRRYSHKYKVKDSNYERFKPEPDYRIRRHRHNLTQIARNHDKFNLSQLPVLYKQYFNKSIKSVYKGKLLDLVSHFDTIFRVKLSEHNNNTYIISLIYQNNNNKQHSNKQRPNDRSTSRSRSRSRDKYKHRDKITHRNGNNKNIKSNDKHTQNNEPISRTQNSHTRSKSPIAPNNKTNEEALRNFEKYLSQNIQKTLTEKQTDSNIKSEPEPKSNKMNDKTRTTVQVISYQPVIIQQPSTSNTISVTNTSSISFSDNNNNHNSNSNNQTVTRTRTVRKRRFSDKPPMDTIIIKNDKINDKDKDNNNHIKQIYCSNCNIILNKNDRLFKCNSCQIKYYCNNRCKLKHWNVHETECIGLRDKKINDKRVHVKNWNFYGIIYWLNRVNDCELKSIKYRNLRKSIFISKINGSELLQITNMVLRMNGISNITQQNHILNLIKDLYINDNIDNRIANSIKTDSVPIEYCDDVSFEIMRDPVKIRQSGYYYERDFIQRYINKYKHDPVTKERIELSDIVNCRELKNKISNWRRNNFDGYGK